MEEVIDAYFAAICRRDIDALSALYAEDAVFILPDGREHAGRDAIRAMHAYVFEIGAPVPTPGARIVAAAAAAVEIEARLPDRSVRHTTNHFFLDADGRIARLNVYMKAPLG